MYPFIQVITEQWHCRGTQKSPRPSHGQDKIVHPMSFLTCFLRSFLKTSSIAKTASSPQKLLQNLTAFIIVIISET